MYCQEHIAKLMQILHCLYFYTTGDRNVAGMKHNQGIVEYYHVWKKDRLGGGSIVNHNTALNAMEKIDYTHGSFDDMKHSFTIPREDGDTVSLKFIIGLTSYLMSWVIGLI